MTPDWLGQDYAVTFEANIVGFSKQFLEQPELAALVANNTLADPDTFARLSTAERTNAGNPEIVRRETVPQRLRKYSFTYEIQLSSSYGPYGHRDYIELPCCLSEDDKPLAEAILCVLVRYNDIDTTSVSMTALRTIQKHSGVRNYIKWPTFWPDYTATVQQARALLAMAKLQP